MNDDAPREARQPNGLFWLGLLIVALLVTEVAFFTIASLLPDDRIEMPEH